MILYPINGKALKCVQPLRWFLQEPLTVPVVEMFYIWERGTINLWFEFKESLAELWHCGESWADL